MLPAGTQFLDDAGKELMDKYGRPILADGFNDCPHCMQKWKAVTNCVDEGWDISKVGGPEDHEATDWTYLDDRCIQVKWQCPDAPKPTGPDWVDLCSAHWHVDYDAETGVPFLTLIGVECSDRASEWVMDGCGGDIWTTDGPPTPPPMPTTCCTQCPDIPSDTVLTVTISAFDNTWTDGGTWWARGAEQTLSLTKWLDGWCSWPGTNTEDYLWQMNAGIGDYHVPGNLFNLYRRVRGGVCGWELDMPYGDWWKPGRSTPIGTYTQITSPMQYYAATVVIS